MGQDLNTGLHNIRKQYSLYRVIKTFLCTWWLQYRTLQVMFKVSTASLQTFINKPNCILEDRVQYRTVHIAEVLSDDYLQIINCVGIVRIHWVRCIETFRSPCTLHSSLVTIRHTIGSTQETKFQLRVYQCIEFPRTIRLYTLSS